MGVLKGAHAFKRFNPLGGRRWSYDFGSMSCKRCFDPIFRFPL